MCRSEWRSDRGSSTALAAGLIAVVLTVTLAVLAVLSAVRAAHVARSSADLSALAAAGVYQEGLDATGACAEAGRIAARHETRLSSCVVGGEGSVTVTVSARIPLRLAGVGPEVAEGRARAGPAPL